MDNEVWYKLECLQIQRAVFNVYKNMGRGHQVTDYKASLIDEFSKLGIPFTEQPQPNHCQLEKFNEPYSPHFICHGIIAVKIKVLPATHHEHKTRIGNYLKASKTRLGILANFGCHPRATVEKFAL
ncbi:GxxExxY protein [Solimicrobium silvestre]|uniref:GxxExxY: GxxExxY protein n=1 Tax=Solimicrobium silvestre TaxID=2099400 RepID=A0A2S9H533_9BURK|nr:GxxExxY protein [Solimicrobium silvestre]PRC95051.1 GxxExxY: GxxExxY protein [Solimicrobium silvestre]